MVVLTAIGLGQSAVAGMRESARLRLPLEVKKHERRLTASSLQELARKYSLKGKLLNYQTCRLSDQLQSLCAASMSTRKVLDNLPLLFRTQKVQKCSPSKGSRCTLYKLRTPMNTLFLRTRSRYGCRLIHYFCKLPPKQIFRIKSSSRMHKKRVCE